MKLPRRSQTEHAFVQAATTESPDAPEAPDVSAGEPTPEVVEVVAVDSNDDAQAETVVAVETFEASEAPVDEPTSRSPKPLRQQRPPPSQLLRRWMSRSHPPRQSPRQRRNQRRSQQC